MSFDTQSDIKHVSATESLTASNSLNQSIQHQDRITG